MSNSGSWNISIEIDGIGTDDDGKEIYLSFGYDFWNSLLYTFPKFFDDSMVGRRCTSLNSGHIDFVKIMLLSTDALL